MTDFTYHATNWKASQGFKDYPEVGREIDAKNLGINDQVLAGVFESDQFRFPENAYFERSIDEVLICGMYRVGAVRFCIGYGDKVDFIQVRLDADEHPSLNINFINLDSDRSEVTELHMLMKQYPKRDRVARRIIYRIAAKVCRHKGLQHTLVSESNSEIIRERVLALGKSGLMVSAAIPHGDNLTTLITSAQG